MITREDLKIILQEGEGYKVEFKEDVSGIDKDMVAFANSSSGKILLGVKDDGKVIGIKIINRLKSQVQDIPNRFSHCLPLSVTVCQKHRLTIFLPPKLWEMVREIPHILFAYTSLTEENIFPDSSIATISIP